MSEENVELTRRVLEAFNARDIDAMVIYADPNVELHSTFEAIGSGIYHGHDGLRMWHRDLREAWGDEIRHEPEAFFDLGEHTLAFTVLHGRGAQSFAEVALPIAAAFTWRDGRAVLVKGYPDRRAALSDLGVSLDELAAIAP